MPDQKPNEILEVEREQLAVAAQESDTALPASPPAAPKLAPIIRGGLAFVLISAGGIALAAVWKAPAAIKTILGANAAAFLAIVLPLTALDFILGGLRYRILFNGSSLPRISLWRCMCSNWANIFMGAVTPSQTGGGAAQLYVLWRYGAKVWQGILASLLNYAATLVFFLVMSLIAQFTLPSDLLGDRMAVVFKALFIAVGVLSAAVLLVLIFPSSGLLFIRKLVGLVPSRLSRVRRAGERLLQHLASELDAFRNGFLEIARNQKQSLFLIVVVTFPLFLNKYLIGYVIARSLQDSVPLVPFFNLQFLQHLFVYFAPTPGASGLAELSSTWLLDSLLAAQVLVFYAVVWRFFTTVLGALLGLWVVIMTWRLPSAQRA
jgi:uncharacterized protein (TIRG00374 family)